jgi:plasmid stability protein
MPSLQVRELPDNIYRLLQEQAATEHRSLAQEAIVTLAKGLETTTSNKKRRNKLLADFIAHPCDCEQKISTLDPVSLLREDRDR